MQKAKLICFLINEELVIVRTVCERYMRWQQGGNFPEFHDQHFPHIFVLNVDVARPREPPCRL